MRGAVSRLTEFIPGRPGPGKTTNILQMSDPAFHDTIVKNTNCSIEDDLPTSSPCPEKV